jgi:hypothetical protein
MKKTQLAWKNGSNKFNSIGPIFFLGYNSDVSDGICYKDFSLLLLLLGL